MLSNKIYFLNVDILMPFSSTSDLEIYPTSFNFDTNIELT